MPSAIEQHKPAQNDVSMIVALHDIMIVQKWYKSDKNL